MENRKKLVLIVDDNQENREILGTILADNGYDVGVCIDGYKAFEFLKEVHPDLILLDIMMPGLDGYEVCKRIKNQSEIKHIPIIFLSAKSATEDIVKGFEAGGIDYVSKPFIKKELLARVNTHIENKILKSLLPICSSCKKIRNDQGYWTSIEHYIENHSNTLFSHGLCDSCMKEIYGDRKWFKKTKQEK